jgi:hypothetical protein
LKIKAIKFANEWSKLKDSFFLTVRWTDSEYIPHQEYPIHIRGKNKFKGVVVFTTNTKLKNLLFNEFTRYDADCSPEQYYNMIKRWYSRKKDWKKENSMVQVVGVRKCIGKRLMDFGSPLP